MRRSLGKASRILPLTNDDHLKNLQARLKQRLAEIDTERQEVLEMLDMIDRAPRVLGKVGTVRAPVEQAVKSVGRTVQNRNVTELVRQFIDGYERNTAIDIPALVRDYLVAQHGVKGKYRSLYSAVCVILKKETKPTTGRNQARLAYEKGIGFFKPRESGGEATET